MLNRLNDNNFIRPYYLAFPLPVMIYGQRTRDSVAHALCLSYHHHHHLPASERSVEIYLIFLISIFFLRHYSFYHSDTAKDNKRSLARFLSGRKIAHRLRRMYLNWITQGGGNYGTWEGNQRQHYNFFHSHATHIFNDIKIPRLTTRKGEKGYEEEWKERCYTLAQMTGVDI